MGSGLAAMSNEIGEIGIHQGLVGWAGNGLSRSSSYVERKNVTMMHAEGRMGQKRVKQLEQLYVTDHQLLL